MEQEEGGGLEIGSITSVSKHGENPILIEKCSRMS